MTTPVSSQPAEVPTLPRGCGWTAIGLGISSLIIGLISLIAIPLLWKRAAEVWTETPATVAEAFVERGERRDHRQRSGTTTGRTKSTAIAVTFTVMLRYDYAVGGKPFSGTAPCLEQPEDDETYAQAAAIIEKFPAGQSMPVYHHPDQPERSRLTEREPRREVVFDLIFAGLFTLIGAAGLFFGRRILGRK